MLRLTPESRGRRPRHLGILTLAALLALPATAAAQLEFLDNEYFKIDLNVRARTEIAKINGNDQSQAFTVRSRVGIGTKPVYGVSLYADLENIFSPTGGEFFDAVESPTGQSVIADPEDTDLNQAYIKYVGGGEFDLTLVAGRQRIKLDDDRFIGNVGWRQNEQTYDAIRAHTSLGFDHLDVMYAHLFHVSRIFGNRGPANRSDFTSDSELFRIAYDRWSMLEIVGFAYLLDFGNSPGNSSDTFGVRLTGKTGLGPTTFLSYILSAAYQTEGNNNPTNYEAAYALAEVTFGWKPMGAFFAGYEHLGSDDGEARFLTPLSTAHKFNGFADAFLNNGGPNGLRDYYVGWAPPLPWGMKGKLFYHHFESDHASQSLGDEFNYVVNLPVTPWLSVLSKGAYFVNDPAGPADRWRFWLDVTVKF